MQEAKKERKERKMVGKKKEILRLREVSAGDVFATIPASANSC